MPIHIILCVFSIFILTSSVRQVKTRFSLTPARVYQIARLRKAQGMIRSLSLSIEAVAEQCGFASRSQFTAAFKAEFGMSPSAVRGTWDKRKI